MLHVSTPTLDACIDAGREHHRAGLYRQAVGDYERVLAIVPAHPQALHYMALARANLGDFPGAMALLRTCLTEEPDNAQGWRDLGKMLMEQGLAEEGVAALRRAVALAPQAAAMFDELGIALHQWGHDEEALDALLQATRLLPSSPYFNDLGLAYQAVSRTDEAVAACREAIARQPDYDVPQANLAALHLMRGEHAEALAKYREALAIQPNGGTFSNIVFALNHLPATEPAEILREARLWSSVYATPKKGRLPPPANDRALEKTLRIGFISGDFREHPVGRFMASWLHHRDRDRIQVTCYSTRQRRDSIAQALQATADVWRPLPGRMDDLDVARQARADGIDILVDLSAHTSGHRLIAFAHRAAPIQVTWLGLCSTTGLDEMDYRLSDPHFDPPGRTEQDYSERTMHLPSTYWCYTPEPRAGEVVPRAGDGEVVFASLNNYSKVTAPALEAWGEIVARVPGSRLVVHSPEGGQREAALAVLASRGVARERVRFFSQLPMGEFFALLGGIDVALDTFPFAGGMTTCDTLWMGVPVVTLRGRTAVGRGGVSILSNIGLPELIATTREAYIEKAVALAGDGGRRAALRGTMRDRMRVSPLMDGARFARDFENAVRRMWQDPRTRP